MTDVTITPTYFDLHQDLYRSHFARGLAYEDYLTTAREVHLARWRTHEAAVSLDGAQRVLLAGFTRRMNLLCLSGSWCGDCARMGPVLRAIEQASPNLVLRFLDRDANPDLRDQLRIAGAGRVPNTVVLSEDFFLVDRLGDRMLATYRRMAAEKLGPSCPIGIGAPPADEMRAITDEMLDDLERAQLALRLSPMLRERHGD
jgi:thiol-disulfide isomerase/thioredoxin